MTVKEWQEYCKSDKKPKSVPGHPDRVYKNKGWEGWGHFLGTGRIANQDKVFLPIELAKEYVSQLKIRSAKEWYKYCVSGDKPQNIPSAPDLEYRNKGWVNWGDWLGNDKYERFRPFQDAKGYVRQLKIRTSREWLKYCKSGDKPDDIPSYPNEVYGGYGWADWYDWLGTSKKEWMGFLEAKNYVISLKLKSTIQWDAYCKSGNKPINIPSHPDREYKNKGWVSWYDWLGKNK